MILFAAVLHGAIAFALLCWLVYSGRSLVLSAEARSLWLAMLALAVGELLHIPTVIRELEAVTGAGWPMVFIHAAGLGAAIAVADLLNLLLDRGWRYRGFTLVTGIGAIVVSALPWLGSPQPDNPSLRGAPSYYAASWASVTHWAAFLAYLGAVLALGAYWCRRSLSQVRGAAAAGLRLVFWGFLAGLTYVLGHGAIQLLWIAHPSASLSLADEVVDLLSLGPSLTLITLGTSWAAVMARLDTMRTRSRVARLLPLWESFVAVDETASPWPDTVRGSAGREDRDLLKWRQMRIVTEVEDVRRRVTAHVPPHVHEQVAEMRLQPAVAAEVLWRVGVAHRSAGQPAGDEVESAVAATTSVEAAIRLDRLARKLRSRACQDEVRLAIEAIEAMEAGRDDVHR